MFFPRSTLPPSARTFHLNHINGDLLLSHAEDLKVGNDALKWFKISKDSYLLKTKPCISSFAPTRLPYLRSFRSPVHFHAQIISVSLPVQFAVDHVEQVADTDLLAGRQLHQSHSGWDVLVLRDPERYDVVTRRP